MPLLLSRFWRACFFLSSLVAVGTTADPYPPEWQSSAGAAIHYEPVNWPSEPASPLDCGESCGDWKPYTRFQNSIADARNQDQLNGGTSPQTPVQSKCHIV